MNISGIGGSGGMPDFSRIQQMRQQAFSKADGDGSGGLSIAEFKGMEGPGGVKPSEAQAEQAFKAFDGDGDGQLTQSEMDDGVKKMMPQMSTQMFSAFSSSSAKKSEGDSLQQLQTLLASLQAGQKDGGIRLQA